ncbi:MAG: insulinase family protein [Oscillospiraceae bacterium]|nr:insulinase family protein [Oscillospiraceae bacterium]
MMEKIHSDIVRETCLKYVHSSGVRVFMHPMDGYSTVTAQFTAKFGSTDNAFSVNGGEITHIPDGTAHYLEHKLFESDEVDAFKLFARTGAYCNAGTSFDYTQYYFSCTSCFRENLEILLDFVQAPYFTPENVEKERGIIGQEITMYRDSPNWRVFTNLLEGLYSVNPVRNDIAGTVESIAQITEKTLYDCYNAYYNPANMFLCIAGCFDPDEVIEVCEEKLKKREPLNVQPAPFDEPYAVNKRCMELTMPVAKPIFEIGFKRPFVSGQAQIDEYIYFNILFDMLFGSVSDFFERLRGDGLVNDQFSDGVFSGRGFCIPFARGESPDPDKVLEEVRNELRKFKAEPPPRGDFDRIKRATYGSFVRYYGNPDSVANTLTEAALCGASPFAMINTAAGAEYEKMLEYLNGLDEENVCISIVKGD